MTQKEEARLDNSFLDMDAIFEGVQRRYELLLRLNLVMTRETVEIARRLGIDNQKIQKWLNARNTGSLSIPVLRDIGKRRGRVC